MGSLQDESGVYSDKLNAPASEKPVDIESPTVLLALSAAFERLVHRNEQSLKCIFAHRKLTPFHGVRAPDISILKYLQRIYKYTNCSPSCFVVGFIFIDQLVHRQPDCPLISLNLHRLVITSIMVATKLLDDVHYDNAFYSKVGGISLAELNSLELDFLFRLNFQLHVTSSNFEGYCTHLEKEVMLSGHDIGRAVPIYSNTEEEEMIKADDADSKQIKIDSKKQLRCEAASPGFE